MSKNLRFLAVTSLWLVSSEKIFVSLVLEKLEDVILFCSAALDELHVTANGIQEHG